MNKKGIDRFFDAAPLEVQELFARDCANRAIQEYAPLALRRAGIEDVATTLEKLSVPTHDWRKAERYQALDELYGVLNKALARAKASFGGRGESKSLRSSSHAEHTVREVFRIMEKFPKEDFWGVSVSAVACAGEAHFSKPSAVGREVALQEEWIRLNFSEGMRAYNSRISESLDAYIAEGVILED